MKMAPACRACILEQAITTAHITKADDARRARIEAIAARLINEAPEDATAPEIAADIYAEIAKLTGDPDPYLSRKKKSTEEALSILPRVRDMVQKSPDPLTSSLLAAAAGNIIDFGIPSVAASPRTVLDEFDELTFYHDDFPVLKDALHSAGTILFLADNAGELVFDRLFLDYAADHFKARITLAVRGGPIINDVTREDAAESHIDDRIELIDTGCAVPGALLSRASDEFLDVFHKSDVIISKGQGNFEVLEGTGSPIFFILKAKCDVVAEYLGVPKGSLLLLKNRPDFGCASLTDTRSGISR